jgi:hypothetical protein
MYFLKFSFCPIPELYHLSSRNYYKVGAERHSLDHTSPTRAWLVVASRLRFFGRMPIFLLI